MDRLRLKFYFFTLLFSINATGLPDNYTAVKVGLSRTLSNQFGNIEVTFSAAKEIIYPDSMKRYFYLSVTDISGKDREYVISGKLFFDSSHNIDSVCAIADTVTLPSGLKLGFPDWSYSSNTFIDDTILDIELFPKLGKPYNIPDYEINISKPDKKIIFYNDTLNVIKYSGDTALLLVNQKVFTIHKGSTFSTSNEAFYIVNLFFGGTVLYIRIERLGSVKCSLGDSVILKRLEKSNIIVSKALSFNKKKLLIQSGLELSVVEPKVSCNIGGLKILIDSLHSNGNVFLSALDTVGLTNVGNPAKDTLIISNYHQIRSLSSTIKISLDTIIQDSALITIIEGRTSYNCFIKKDSSQIFPNNVNVSAKLVFCGKNNLDQTFLIFIGSYSLPTVVASNNYLKQKTTHFYKYYDLIGRQYLVESVKNLIRLT
jgi:hypothetical protein